MASENERTISSCLRRLVRWFCDVRMIGKCREVLWSELDRYRDESDSLHSLVVIAVNALHYARQAQEVRSALVEQDIRDIIAHNGTVEDVLKYLTTARTVINHHE